jgi:hypothetical protein
MMNFLKAKGKKREGTWHNYLCGNPLFKENNQGISGGKGKKFNHKTPQSGIH